MSLCCCWWSCRGSVLSASWRRSVGVFAKVEFMNDWSWEFDTWTLFQLYCDYAPVGLDWRVYRRVQFYKRLFILDLSLGRPSTTWRCSEELFCTETFVGGAKETVFHSLKRLIWHRFQVSPAPEYQPRRDHLIIWLLIKMRPLLLTTLYSFIILLSIFISIYFLLI